MSKKFDAVAWMRQRRAEIDKEDEGLTWEEKTRKTLSLLHGAPLWERVKTRRVKAISHPLQHAAGNKE